MNLHIRNFYKIFLFFVIIPCILSGCAQKQSGNADFNEYTNQLFTEEICANTINLHYTLAYPENYGIKNYTPSLGNFTLEELAQYTDDLLSLKEELSAFEYDTLDTDQQLTYDIIADYIDTELSASDLYLYDELLSPTVGYQSQLPVLLAEYTFRTEKDIDNYLELCGQISFIFDSILEFERAKSSAGLFMADFAVDDIISQMQDFIAVPSDNYMIAVFNDKIDAFTDFSDELRQSYKDKNYDLIINCVIPAYQTLIDGLSDLKGTGQNPGGLCYLPDGIKYYEYLVRSKTGSSKTVEQLKKNTEEFIMDSLTEMASVIQTHPEILDELDTCTFELTEPDAILKDLISKVTADFPEAPDVNYTIKYVHESMAEDASPAFYLTPPIDDIQNNIIYINPNYLSDDIYITLAHEGYPGHLYQTVYTSSKNLPLVRNLFSYPGYSEGWATYVEYYSYGISGLDENLAKVLSLNNAASLGLYAYIDLSVNYDGWDVQEVNNYLSMFGFTDETIADEIFRAMVEEPANYLSYFIGYLEFLELREEAEKLCGTDFSLKEFHETVLTLGPAPFDILAGYMKASFENNN